MKSTWRGSCDTQKNAATGEGINSFGGTWHVIKLSGPAPNVTPSPTPPPHNNVPPAAPSGNTTGSGTSPMPPPPYVW